MPLRYNANLEAQYPADTFLGQVEKPTLRVLSEIWSEISYLAGTTVLSAEETTHDVFFVLEGTVRAAVYSARGREVTLATLSDGACFGEFSAIDGEPRSANVVTTTDCRLARLPDAQFREVLAGRPDLALLILKLLVARLRDLTRRVGDFSGYKADDRIRLELIRIAKAEAGSDDTVLIPHPPTQADLAAFVFTNREAVAREIGAMKKSGLLEGRGRSLFIPSINALEVYQVSRLRD